MRKANINVPLKTILYALADFLLTCLVWFLYFASFIFRGPGITHEQTIGMIIYFTSMGALIVILFAITRVYRLILRNIGTPDMAKVGLLTLLVQVVGLVCLMAIPDKYLLNSQSVFIPWAFTALTNIVAICGIRLIPRFAYSYFESTKEKTIKTLIIGAGSAAKIVLDDTRKNKDFHNKVIAFVDDDKNKIGGKFSGVPVKGPISDVAKIIEEYEIDEVIIAISELTPVRMREILSYMENSNVRIRKMPSLLDMNGPNDHRVVDVDLDELLCRPPVQLDNHEVQELLHRKTVMVTGAGGSIGSELVRQIFKTHPKTLVLFDIYENSTYDIQMELVRKMREESIIDIELVTLIGSTYDAKRVEHVIKKYRPDYIYHAAAYKHVPLMEDSPMEAIRTNVIGTYNVARLAAKYKVKKMVLVSTDKAVRPTNTMGATKRFAETIIQYFADKEKNTAYAAVRFGNVLGSNGSVVPLFKKQIEKGGPVTLTHRDIIRYFMTIPEAVSLILQCSLYAKGGEIFILDMGKPVKILTLAEKLIRQSGYIPGKDIQIVETGLRPGEKLYEELLLDKEHQIKTPNEKIYIEETQTLFPIEEEIKQIVQVFDMENNDDVKDMLASIITTYQRKK